MTEQRPGGLPPVSGSRTLSRDVDRRRQVIAAAAIAGFLVLVLLVWVIVVAGGDDDGPGGDELASAGTDAATGVPDGSGTSGEDDAPDAATDDPETDEPAADDPAANDPETDDPDAGAGDDGEEPDGDADATATLSFDGVCSVEVPQAEAEGDPRPWDFEACEYAPVALESGSERWIVVRASLPADQFDAAAAAGRAESLGGEGRLLFSTHYPSLTPGLWVVFAGPYPDADAARDAASTLGGGAYPRALTDR